MLAATLTSYRLILPRALYWDVRREADRRRLSVAELIRQTLQREVYDE